MDAVREVENYRDASRNKESMEKMTSRAYHCLRIAESLLGEGASEEDIHDQAYDLMPLGKKQVISTLNRLEDKDTSGLSLEQRQMLAEMEEEEEEDEEDEAMEAEDMEEEEEDGEEKESANVSEDRIDAIIEEEMGEQSGGAAEQIVNDMNSGSQDSTVSPTPGGDMNIEGLSGGGMESVEAGDIEQDHEKLQRLFQEDIPEEARNREAATSSSSEFSGQTQTAGSKEGVDKLGGPVKQGSSNSEVDELENLWEHGDDVSDSF
jgi:hypothetical protein